MIRRPIAIVALALLLSPVPGAGRAEAPERDEPVLRLPPLPGRDAGKVALGETLFSDPRLSRTGRTSCATCHDLATNGATARVRDVGDGGQALPFNTPTIFNVAYSYRLNWEGRVRTLPALVESSLSRTDLMGNAPDAAVERLRRDPDVSARVQALYGRPPDLVALIDALTTYVTTLTTPDSAFDRWLGGDREAIGLPARRGYRLFRAIGCASCHQGANVGANLHQRHGIFAPLASPDPPLLRVPSLRNVAVTAPYFHDGSAATLEQAVRDMARAQLDQALEQADVDDVVAFLCSLTGRYRGELLRAPAGSPQSCAAAR